MEMINPQEWKKDLPAFKEKTDRFYAGELSKADYKGFSGGYGSKHDPSSYGGWSFNKRQIKIYRRQY